MRAVKMKTFRHVGEARAELFELVEIDAGAAAARVIAAVAPAASPPSGRRANRPCSACKPATASNSASSRVPPIGLQLFDFARGDDAFGDQLLLIDFERRRMRPDLLVHQGLGEAPARRLRCGRSGDSRTCR